MSIKKLDNIMSIKKLDNRIIIKNLIDLINEDFNLKLNIKIIKKIVKY